MERRWNVQDENVGLEKTAEKQMVQGVDARKSWWWMTWWAVMAEQ